MKPFRILPPSIVAAVAVLFTFAVAQINDASTDYTETTQSRLRIAHFVFDSPNVDVLVNGEVAVISDRPWANIPHGYITGYLYLPPGTYSVAVVPTGEVIEQAILGPLDVELAAGHRYTVAMMGQTTDDALTPLVVDETAEMQKVRTSPTQYSAIYFHNLAGVETMSIAKEQGFGGDINYGEFNPISISLDDERLCNDNIDLFDGEVVFSEPWPDPDTGECRSLPPGEFVLGAYYGRYPGEEGETFAYEQTMPTTDLNGLELLREFNEVDYTEDVMAYKFTTFLVALEKAGMTDFLTTGGPYLIFAPSDDAFAKLPKGELDTLMADTEALENLLRVHIIEGYYPYGTFSVGDSYSGYGRTLKNLAGQDLHLTLQDEEGLHINGISEGYIPEYATSTGTTVRPLPTVLMPPN